MSRILRLHFETPVDVEDFAEAMRAVSASYKDLLAFMVRQERIRTLSRQGDVEEALLAMPSGYLLPPGVAREQRGLQLIRIHASSPGSAEVRGVGGVLEALRRLWEYRHERRKERDWKEDLERERYELDNDLRRLERERVAAEVDIVKAEAAEKRFALYAQVFGVEEARARAIEELRSAFAALEEAGMSIGDLVSGDPDRPDEPGGSDGAEGEEGTSGGGGPGPQDGGDGGDDEGPDPETDPGEDGDAAEPAPWPDEDELVDAIGREVAQV